MRIERNGQLVKLTAKEIEQAYRIKEREYRLEDAKRHILDDFDDEFLVKEYGCFCQDLINEDSDLYLLDIFVDTFFDIFDCNQSENTLWTLAILEALSTLNREFPAYYSVLIDKDKNNIAEHTIICKNIEDVIDLYNALKGNIKERTFQTKEGLYVYSKQIIKNKD